MKIFLERMTKNNSLMTHLAWSALLVSMQATAQFDRSYVYVVGSSTVQPFSEAVADQLTKAKIKRPKIESTGSGGGFTLFCEGAGLDTPDIVNGSRAIKKKEYELCQRNGVNEIVEVKIGYDGIVFAHASKDKPLGGTRKDVYLALAKQVPEPGCKDNCKMVPNPYKTWKQINPAFPDSKIEIYGPPGASGTRDSLEELVLDAGCQSYPWLAAKKTSNESEYRRLCQTIRSDGAYIEMGPDHGLIADRLLSTPNALAIDDYQLFLKHSKLLTAEPIEGVTPTHETIASGRYPVTRPLYFYFKPGHVGLVPGLRQYVAEITSEKAWGDKGYLTTMGLIAMPSAERKMYAADTKSLRPMILGEVRDVPREVEAPPSAVEKPPAKAGSKKKTTSKPATTKAKSKK